MAKKLELTKVMEDALRKANVPEEKIAHLRENGLEIRELSLSDLDAVSGGLYGVGDREWAPDDWRCPTFDNRTWLEFGEFIDLMYQNFGRDVTVNFLNLAYFKSNDWGEKFNPPGLTAYYCAHYMFSLAWNGAGCPTNY